MASFLKSFAETKLEQGYGGIIIQKWGIVIHFTSSVKQYLARSGDEEEFFVKV